MTQRHNRPLLPFGALPNWILLGVICVFLAALVPSAGQGLPGNARPAAESSDDAGHRPQSAAEAYVKVVGGAVAILGTIFGLPLTYQTFRKTRAEITKIELESRKLESDLTSEGVSQRRQDDSLIIRIQGDANNVAVSVDPKYAMAFLLITDGLIAYIYYRIALFAFNLVPLPWIIDNSLSLVLFIIIFLPVFQTARRVKRDLGFSRTQQESAQQA